MVEHYQLADGEKDKDDRLIADQYADKQPFN